MGVRVRKARISSSRRLKAGSTMFITQQMVQTELAWRAERIKRDYRPSRRRLRADAKRAVRDSIALPSEIAETDARAIPNTSGAHISVPMST